MAPERKINSALDDALREMGRPTTPEDLTRRGVRKLRSVGMREVSLLIERAVNRTLVARTLSVAPADVANLVDAAQSEFTRQIQGLQDLADSRELVERHRAEWRSSLDELRRKVAERRGFLEQRPREEPPDARRERLEFERELARTVQSHSGPNQGSALVAALGALCARRSASERESLRSEHDSELARLERRLEKLVASLDGAEQALARAATARAADLGLESIYRDVQGLPSQERGRELKAALMASIFEANLELRQQRAGGSAQQPAPGVASS